MEKKTIIIAASATFIIGIVLSGAIASFAVNGHNTGMMDVYAMHNDSEHGNITANSASSMSMDDMTTDLKSNTGDEFDKAFVAEMITHHKGAIDMANLALTKANHQELKDLAQTIISAQTSEITQMKTWQTTWGYTSNSTMNTHDMMGM